MDKIRIAVVLSGCGNKDGAEIHESVLTLWAIHKHGAEYQCFAPDIPQRQVLNFITNQEMAEERNVLVESARIARSKILDLAEFRAGDYDALIIPGGLGVVKNLSDFVDAGPECTVIPELVRAVKEMAALKKPIGGLCIAPVILARILGNVEVTIGSDPDTVAALEKMGARHSVTSHAGIVIDHRNKVVTTPCYMLDARVDQIGEGVENLVNAVMEQIDW